MNYFLYIHVHVHMYTCIHICVYTYIWIYISSCLGQGKCFFYVFSTFDFFNYRIILVNFASIIDYVHPA